MLMTKPSATLPNPSLPLEQYVLMEALPMETPARLAPHRVRRVQQERRMIVSSVLRVITPSKADVSQLIQMASAQERISLLTTTNVNVIVSLNFFFFDVGLIVFQGCGAKCTSCQIPNFSVASTVNQKQCTGCLPGFFLSNGTCVNACPSGTFVSPQDNLTCLRTSKIPVCMIAYPYHSL